MSKAHGIPLSSPDITAAEIQAVVEVMQSGHLSLGPRIPEFESQFRQYLGTREAVAVSSGTAGLHCCLLGLDVGRGDEVITTPFSFIASANSILMTGARPVFVDIDSRTMNMDPEKVSAVITPRTKAILAVEAFGNPASMNDIAAIAARHELPLVEDACEALGSAYKEKKAGTFGRCGVFAFYPNKQITTGEGGMIVTNDRELAETCRSLRNQGRHGGGGWLAHHRLGYNYRLSDIHAAIGVAQMQRLEEIITQRQRVAHQYVQLLLDNPHIVLPTIDKDTAMSWFVFVVRLTDDFTVTDRDAILQQLRKCNIGCSNYFPPIHLQPFYQEEMGYKPGDYPVTEYASDRTVALPFHNHLTANDCEMVVLQLNKAIAQTRGA